MRIEQAFDKLAMDVQHYHENYTYSYFKEAF